MKLKEIIDFIDEKIPPKLALDFDSVGFGGDYDLTQEINHVKILMDIYPENDFSKDTLVITHHPPLFIPETPTYTVHSNWDIMDGGANESLAESLNLNVLTYFDSETHIGRICECNSSYENLKTQILKKFSHVRVVNEPDNGTTMRKVGIISGFGLKNPDYIRLAEKNKLDVLISGDLTHECAVLAKNLQITLIDLGHHESEVPGLYGLAKIIDKLDVDCEVIDEKPIKKLV